MKYPEVSGQNAGTSEASRVNRLNRLRFLAIHGSNLPETVHVSHPVWQGRAHDSTLHSRSQTGYDYSVTMCHICHRRETEELRNRLAPDPKICDVLKLWSLFWVNAHHGSAAVMSEHVQALSDSTWLNVEKPPISLWISMDQVFKTFKQLKYNISEQRLYVCSPGLSKAKASKANAWWVSQDDLQRCCQFDAIWPWHSCTNRDSDTIAIAHCVSLCSYIYKTLCVCGTIWPLGCEMARVPSSKAWVHELPARACASPGNFDHSLPPAIWMGCATDSDQDDPGSRQSRLIPTNPDQSRPIPTNPDLLFCSKALPQFLNRHLHDSVEASTADEVIFRKYHHDSLHLLNWCH